MQRSYSSIGQEQPLLGKPRGLTNQKLIILLLTAILCAQFMVIYQMGTTTMGTSVNNVGIPPQDADKAPGLSHEEHKYLKTDRPDLTPKFNFDSNDVVLSMYGGQRSTKDPSAFANKMRVEDVKFSGQAGKLIVGGITPRENQMQRGTCWDFATLGVLETSYRQYGVKMGWLKPEQYVKFSEQAYGISVVQKCAENPILCVVPDDSVWLNSTEGGEIPFLYTLGFTNEILPHSVCSYNKGVSGANLQCKGMDKALKTNPINFKIERMTTLYEVEGIKNHLRVHGRALGFSTVMTESVYYYPCIAEHASKEECKLTADGRCKTFCPLNGKFQIGMCCIPVPMGNTNLEGEFFNRGPADYQSGGHAMLVVGYNDNFVTQDGSKGGFILKNNWVTNATHSVEYLMQDISRWDESAICPSTLNPRNWFTCDSVVDCLNRQTAIFAEVTSQPLKLRCVDTTGEICQINEETVYFVKNYTHIGDDMHQICLHRFDERQAMNEFELDLTSGIEDVSDFVYEKCLPMMVLDQIVKYFKPRESKLNDPDRCGFYFFPYKLVDAWWPRFHNSYATDMDITWHESAYAANKHKYPDYDYSLLEKSTRVQRDYHFSGPIPYEYIATPEDLMKKINHLQEHTSAKGI